MRYTVTGQRCPSCREYDITIVYTECPDPDEPGEFRSFSVCRNCDYGINEHTEGECHCPAPRVTVDVDPDNPAQLRIVIKGLSCSVFSVLTQDEARMAMTLLERRLEEVAY